MNKIIEGEKEKLTAGKRVSSFFLMVSEFCVRIIKQNRKINKIFFSLKRDRIKLNRERQMKIGVSKEQSDSCDPCQNIYITQFRSESI